MVSKKTINIIFWVMIFAVLFACLYIIVLLKGDAGQCLANGFTYGAREQVEGDVMCTCTAQNNGQISTFYFNESSWWNKPPERIERDYGTLDPNIFNFTE